MLAVFDIENHRLLTKKNKYLQRPKRVPMRQRLVLAYARNRLDLDENQVVQPRSRSAAKPIDTYQNLSKIAKKPQQNLFS